MAKPPSVTQIINLLPGKREILEKWKARTPDHEKVTRYSSARGKLIHAQIQNRLYNLWEVPKREHMNISPQELAWMVKNGPSISYHYNLVEEMKLVPVMLEEWISKYKPKIIWTEKSLFNKQYFYSGRADMLVEFPSRENLEGWEDETHMVYVDQYHQKHTIEIAQNEHVLLDMKASKETYEDSLSCQFGGYILCDPLKVEMKCFTLRLCPDLHGGDRAPNPPPSWDFEFIQSDPERFLELREEYKKEFGR